ncbi:LAMI_0G13916g1_1 [Lachancea mirantina]|uniref:LAMI_0G13916g1_1 n=1 Tax=Lachancea mirantina TaxID=1230905 RepID=A0A1G4KBZ0_9SACH|nr:LAMI_0G13916g1_1 [Lachancea mirantina]
MKIRVLFGTFVFLSTVYLFYIPISVIFTSWRYHKTEGAYFLRSQNALKAYSNIRRFDAILGAPKLSTNTYLDQIIRKNVSGHSSDIELQNATLLMLVRNWEIEGALKSMRSLEDRFNRNYKYTWTFLNDVPFSGEFIEATTAMASGKTQYGLIPSEDWNRPSWINETEFENCLQLMREKHVIYGESKSYRNMCRFNSGFFLRQAILDKYDYYFRVEPDVDYLCDFPYDPFKIMREGHKKYGFVITIYEYEDTIPTLWDAVEEFIEEHPDLVNASTNSLKFVTSSGRIGKTTPIVESNSEYNLCHFWSNFEIGDLNFFRSEAYLKYFEWLDSKGGFFYERWGDAPVHSLAVALLLDTSEIIHFDELGYFHAPFSSCPDGRSLRLAQRCICDIPQADKVDIAPNSCLMRWWKDGGGKRFMKNK